jgi:hypothetical membrane protein
LIKGLDKTSYVLGMLIPVWLFLGVSIAGALYPDYSQMSQAMSELGAVGAPTRYLSPVINNYPLGLLFIMFGIAVFRAFPESFLSKLSGVLIAVHGVGSVLAGYFPCDQGCNPVAPSETQILHFSSGMVMFVSLMIANLLWVYLGKTLFHSRQFVAYSLCLAIVAVGVLPSMAQAMQTETGVGIYQRINYGAHVLWLAGLAYVLLQRANRQR